MGKEDTYYYVQVENEEVGSNDQEYLIQLIIVYASLISLTPLPYFLNPTVN